MFEIVKDFEADSLMHMVALLSATAEKTVISMGIKYGWTYERARSSKRI